MPESITVPDQWNIETAVGRFADTEFLFTYAGSEEETITVELRGAGSSPESVTYTLSVIETLSAGGADEHVVFQTTDEDTAMAGTDCLLHRLQQAMQTGDLSSESGEDKLKLVLNHVARRFDRPLLGRFFSLFRPSP